VFDHRAALKKEHTMANLRELVARNRSYRRFDESHCVARETLVELVGLARCTPSAANRQPLKYILAADQHTNERIFPCLTWAAYLKDWEGPAPGERPTAYIVILIDETITKDWWCDDGIAAQTIALGAVEKGLGVCMIGSINKRCVNVPACKPIPTAPSLGCCAPCRRRV
jgi:nitroreductase